MAFYRIKYKIGFYDKNNNYYEAWLKKKDYTGTASYIKSGTQPCVISLLTSDDILEPIKGQELVLQLISVTDYQFSEFFSANDREFIVELHPDQDIAVARMILTSIDSGATADPSIDITFTNYSTNTGQLPEADFNVLYNLNQSWLPKATITLYWEYDQGGVHYKKEISKVSNISGSESIAQLAQAIITNISDSSFTGTYVSGGHGTIVAADFIHSNGLPISNTLLTIHSSSALVGVSCGNFSLGIDPDSFSIRIGYERSKKVNGLTLRWYDYASGIFAAKSGETIIQLCDRIAAAIDNTPAGIFYYSIEADSATDFDWNTDLADYFGVDVANWVIRASHNGSGTITFTLESGGADYNNEDITFYGDVGDTGEFIISPVQTGYHTLLFTGGVSTNISYTIQVDTGSGFATLVSYTKSTGDTLIDIIEALVNLINTTTSYTSEVDPNDSRALLIYPPSGQTGEGWHTQWVLTGTSTGISEDFSLVNPSITTWKGFVIPNLYREPHKNEPYEVSLSATDGIGDLKSYDFLDVLDNEITGDISLMQAIVVCLSKTGLDLKIIEGINIYEDNFDNTSNDSPLDQSFVDAILFKNKKCDEVLRDILTEFVARIYQYNGYWIIEHIPGTYTSQYRRIFDKDGNYESVTSEYNEITLFGGNVNYIIAGSGTIEIEPAYKEIRTRYDYGTKIQLLKNASFDNLLLDGTTWLRNGPAYWFPGESYGYPSVMQDLGDNYSYTGTTGYLYQSFYLEANSDHKYRITTKTMFFDDTPGGVTPSEFSKLMIKLTGTSNTYYADNNGEWQITETFISLDYENKKWIATDLLINSLPEDGTLQFRLYHMHLSVAVSNCWVGWDYATFAVIANIPNGEYAATRYEDSYKLYNTIKELTFFAADVPNISSRATVFSNVLKNSDGEPLRTWDTGKTLTSIARYELLKQYGRYGQRLVADIYSETCSFNHIIKDSTNNNKKFLINGASWDIRANIFSGEWVEIAKPLLSETIVEIFMPWEEEKTGNETYNPVSGGGTNNVIAEIPADVLRESDVLDILTSNSPYTPLSANQGRVLKALIDAITLKLNEAYTALTSNSSVSWDTSQSLNKTWSIDGSYTLTLTNFSNGMSGNIKITISATATITLAATGVTFKGNGSLASLAAGVYHLAWVCTSSTTIEWNIAQYS